MRLSCRCGVRIGCFAVMRHRMPELTDDEPRHEKQNHGPALKELASHPRSVSPLRQGRNRRAPPLKGFPSGTQSLSANLDSTPEFCGSLHPALRGTGGSAFARNINDCGELNAASHDSSLIPIQNLPREHPHVTRKHATCIDACSDCATACDRCANACLQEQDVKSLARCIGLNIDCADICRTATGFMSRDSDSEFTDAICAACAEICEACAEECERHDMDHCRECAAACRRCADECRRMPGQRSAAGAQEFRRTCSPVIAS